MRGKVLIGAAAVALAAAGGVAFARRRGLTKRLGLRIKDAAGALFWRAEARGAFRRMPAFERDYHADYPALRLLEENYADVRAECLALLGRREDLPDVDKLMGDYTAGGIHSIAWKSFMFKSGKFIDENCALAPKTAAVLRRIPGVYTAFFSILEPHQKIKPHWGYWKGFVRYHLGVVIPDDNREKLCWLRINTQVQDRDRAEEVASGETYYWRNGEGVMFDDTFLHDAANASGEVRVVLWLDVARRMPAWLGLLNRLFLEVAHMDASVRSVRENARVTRPAAPAPAARAA